MNPQKLCKPHSFSAVCCPSLSNSEFPSLHRRQPPYFLSKKLSLLSTTSYFVMFPFINNRNHNPYHQSFFKKKLSSTLLIEIATLHEETHLLLKQTQPVLVKFKRFLIYFSWLFEFKRFPVKIFVYVRFFLTVVSKGEQPWLLERSFGEESMSRGWGRERDRRFREFFFFFLKKVEIRPLYFATTNIYLVEKIKQGHFSYFICKKSVRLC